VPVPNIARRAAVAVLAAAALGAAALGAGVALARIAPQEGPPAPDAPAAPAAPAAKKPVIGDLAWMAGNWIQEDHDSTFEEVWLPPSGGTMVAASRMVARGKTPLVEMSSIEADAAGDLHIHIRHFSATLVPWKSETETPRWKLASAGENSVVFEEPSRDFPRTVTYRAGKDDTLEAVLDGTRGGKPAHMEFKFRRAK
jgi:hypothetical protein